MSSEARLWGATRAALQPYGKLVRIENVLEPGTPDVNYILRYRKNFHPGWLELKYEEGWPSREKGRVGLSTLSLAQVLWAEEWDRAGGKVNLLARIGTDCILFAPTALRRLYSKQYTREDFQYKEEGLGWVRVRMEGPPLLNALFQRIYRT